MLLRWKQLLHLNQVQLFVSRHDLAKQGNRDADKDITFAILALACLEVAR
jgi:hypothetical protein